MNRQGFDKDQEGTENKDNMASSDQNTEPGEDTLGTMLNTDDSIAGTANPDIDMSEDEMAVIRAERDEIQDKYIRLMAEFENFRKRNARERVELIQTAGRDVMQSLLDVLDDMDRAMAQMASSDDLAANREGISLVFNKLYSTLQGKGLRVMECAGAEFDPELHEAVAEIQAPSADMKGHIVDVLQKGYYLNDKLIRHAKVVVGK